MKHFKMSAEKILKLHDGDNPFCMDELATLLTSFVVTSQIMQQVHDVVGANRAPPACILGGYALACARWPRLRSSPALHAIAIAWPTPHVNHRTVPTPRLDGAARDGTWPARAPGRD